LITLTYYRDQDGDGFGNNAITTVSCVQPAGFVLNNTDCNDNNANVFPGRTEACNGIDDDCDTVIDEGCGVINDEFFTGLPVSPTAINTCGNTFGTLAGAFPSAEADIICPTGEDVWYYFTANTTAVSIVCNSSVNDILLELQTDLGALIASENAVSGIGSERMNFVGLTLGETYFIAVRNFNSNVSAGGSFQICVQRLVASSCDINTSPTNRLSPCNSFKADFTAANQYIFHIGSITYTTGLVAGQASPWINLVNVPGLQYGAVYNVTVDAVYTLPFGSNQTEVITVPGFEVCQLYIANQPSVQLRVADRCPSTKLRHSIVRAEPRVCGDVIDYEWEFTQVLPSPGLPQTHLRGANDRLLRLSNVLFLQNGATYDVRIRPIFASGPGAWSASPVCMRIAGSAGMVVSKDDNASIETVDRKIALIDEEVIEVNLFPNPNNGDVVNLVLGGSELGNVLVNITDPLGRNVYNNRFVIEQPEFSTQIEFSTDITSGVYFVEIISNNNRREVRKLIIQH
jgi:hypothetical protein